MRFFYSLLICVLGAAGILQGGSTPMPVAVGAHGAIVGHYDVDYIKGATVDKVVLHVPDGKAGQTIDRQGMLVRYPDAQATILMCHGFMCDKFDQGFLRRLFPRGRYNLMTFDFRAHGANTQGQCCTFGRDEAQDVIAAAQFLKKHPQLKNKPLFVYGFSMGAVAAIQAQAKDPSLFKAMILDCPFDSSEQVIKRALDQIKFSFFGYEFGLPGRGLLSKYAFHPYVQSLIKSLLRTVAKMDIRDIDMYLYPVDTVETIKKVSVPQLLVSCKNDERVSVEGMKTIYSRSAALHKILWITNGRHHFDSYFYNPEKYTERVRRFLEHALNGTVYEENKNEIIEDVNDEENITHA